MNQKYDSTTFELISSKNIVPFYCIHSYELWRFCVVLSPNGFFYLFCDRSKYISSLTEPLKSEKIRYASIMEKVQHNSLKQRKRFIFFFLTQTFAVKQILKFAKIFLNTLLIWHKTICHSSKKISYSWLLKTFNKVPNHIGSLTINRFKSISHTHNS